MKTFIYCIAMAALMAALPACAGTGSQNRRTSSGASGALNSGVLGQGLNDGEYEGTALGYRGDIHVRVRIDGGIISEIEILESREDRFVGGAAIEELHELALIYNTADLDAVSGATESSEGFLAALANALEHALKIRLPADF